MADTPNDHILNRKVLNHMTSSWASNGPKSKVVNTHYHVAWLYGIGIAIFAAVSAIVNLMKGISMANILPDIIIIIVFIALIFAHLKTSSAAEKDQKWAPIVSLVLSVPLLIVFPIGTFFGIKLLVNAIKLLSNPEAAY